MSITPALTRRVAASLLCVGLFTAACTSDNDGETSSGSAPPSAPQPATSPGPASTADMAESGGRGPARDGETIAWESCGAGHCARIKVPVSYDDPSLGTIDLALNVLRATGADEDWLGYLFVNPGGPGDSGVEFAEAVSFGGFTEEVLARFDLIGFDPRGVGASEPRFTCGDGRQYRQLSDQIEGQVDTGPELVTADEIAGLCEAAMGPVAHHLHSANVARDMDEIRAALGADQISYYGASYGSTLGVWFATLFPDSVRAMVVDGADNPVTEPTDDLDTELANRVEELSGFETQLGAALAACADETCPIYNNGDPEGYLALAGAKAHLVQEASATRSPMAALFGVLTTLYGQEGWPQLYGALFHLVQNDDATELAELAGYQLGDVAGMNIAAQVNCLDSWVLSPELAAYAPEKLADEAELDARLKDALPLLGRLVVGEEFDPCPFYGAFAPGRLEGSLNGSDVAILVIGNPSDPATPYVESEQLANDVLSNGYLLRVDHPNHVVYLGGPNECVNQHVDAMLLDATPPPERFVECPAVP